MGNIINTTNVFNMGRYMTFPGLFCTKALEQKLEIIDFYGIGILVWYHIKNLITAMVIGKWS